MIIKKKISNLRDKVKIEEERRIIDLD